MNARRPHTRRARGIMLIECLVYIALVMVIAGLAMAAFYETWEAHKHLDRVTNDIVRALKAGEQWRADVRACDGPPQWGSGDAGAWMRLPRGTGFVEYRFHSNAVWRATGDDRPPAAVLERVAACRWVAESLTHVEAARWELRLETRRQEVRMEPLFTFQAAPWAGGLER